MTQITKHYLLLLLLHKGDYLIWWQQSLAIFMLRYIKTFKNDKQNTKKRKTQNTEKEIESTTKERQGGLTLHTSVYVGQTYTPGTIATCVRLKARFWAMCRQWGTCMQWVKLSKRFLEITNQMIENNVSVHRTKC